VLLHMLRGTEEYTPTSGEIIFMVAMCSSCGWVPLDPQMVEAADSVTSFVLHNEFKLSKAFGAIVKNVRAFVEE
jgi:C4-type Zn-finger protein